MNPNPDIINMENENPIKNMNAKYASASIIVIKSDENTALPEHTETENNLINIESIAAEVDKLTYIEEKEEPENIIDAHEVTNIDIIEKTDQFPEETEIKVIPEKTKNITDEKVVCRDSPEKSTESEAEKVIYPEIEIKESTDLKKENIFTIEIPDIIFNSLPDNFNIHELGKVDLREAESIASEDILSLVKDDLRDEMEELNFISAENAEYRSLKDRKETNDTNSNAEIKVNIKEVPSKEISEDNKKKSTDKAETEETEIYKEIKANINTPDNSQTGSINQETAHSKIQDEINSRMTQNPENMQADVFEKIPGEVDIINHENLNVYIIDDEFVKKDNTAGIMFETNELEKGISAIDMIGGDAKQLEESASEEKNDIIGILGDKPIFDDLLFDMKDTHRFVDDEIDFIDESFMAEEFKDYMAAERDNFSEYEEEESTGKDIKASSALMIEEDIENINEKIEDLMKKQIQDTIQDITDRITIFEDEADFKKFIEKMPKVEKENVKKLLNYLNDLLDKLPEEEIKNFAKSEYYDLYIKLLKNMDN